MSETQQLRNSSESQNAEGPHAVVSTVDLDRVEQEIAKLQTEGESAVAWREVREGCLSYLSHHEKDLKLAAYWVVASQRVDGWQGAAEAMVQLVNMLGEHWDDLKPPPNRLKGRARHFQWIGERLFSVSEKPVDSQDKEPLEKLLSSFEQGSRLLTERGATVELGATYRQIKSLLREISRKEQALVEKKEARSTAPAVITSEPEALNALRSAEGSIAQVAAYFRRSDITHPLSYQLRRTTSWARILTLPIDGAAVGPDPQQREEIERARESASPTDLIELCEAQFAKTPLWLDLGYYVGQVLEKTEPGFEAAVSGIKLETTFLVNRLPGLGELSLQGGTKVLSPTAREWLLAEERAAEVNDEVPGVDAVTALEAELSSLQGSAGSSAIISVFQAAMLETRSGKDRFMIQLMLAEYCSASGIPELAYTSACDLENEVEQQGLESWDPDLALRASCNYLEVSRARNDAPEVEHSEQIARAKARILRLSPETALELFGKR